MERFCNSLNPLAILDAFVLFHPPEKRRLQPDQQTLRNIRQRAKAFAARRELSLAEVTRRGLELFPDRFPSTEPARGTWSVPRVDADGIKVPLDSLRDIAADDEINRSLANR